jgi:Ca2+-binding RTX toxin-like protein
LIIAVAVALLLVVSSIAVARTFTCNQNRCRGTNDRDTIFGNRVGNTIHSLKGADLVRGNGGKDSLHGDGGRDRLSGGNGDDVVNGDDADDVVIGNRGNDRLNAGNGDDRVEAADGDFDPISCGSGRHDIAIFDRGVDSVIRCEIKRRR